MESNNETVVLGGGCFLCTEAVFKMLKGVVSVEPGYAGGNVKNPSYEQVCTGDTGHAEVTKVVYDRSEVSLEDILSVFFATHDPTTLHRQGNDVGTQYRSVILYTTEAQRDIAEKIIADIDASSTEGNPVVTQVQALAKEGSPGAFYPAEDYHKNYCQKNKNKLYCQVIINPKLKKVQEKFAQLLNK